MQRDIKALDAQIESETFVFEDSADQYRHRVMAQLVREIWDFVQNDELPDVEKRLAAAKTVHEQTISAYQAKWDEAIAAIKAADDVRASNKYAKLDLVPQLGLVPLDMDPESKLWEFVHLASGTPGKEFPVRDPVTKQLVPTGDMGLVFVLIPGGTLPPGTKDEGKETSVRLDKQLDAFFLSKYEMTQGQWFRLARSNPGRHVDQSNAPFGWKWSPGTRGPNDQMSFWLNEQPESLPAMTRWHWMRMASRKPPPRRRDSDLALPVDSVDWFTCDQHMRHQDFALPSELRWEYSCRAGTTTQWWSGDDENSLAYCENIGHEADRLLRVGSKQPNPFGLFDMVGNLSEWCSDSYGSYGTERSGDGSRHEPTTSAQNRCCRGGYYDLIPRHALSGDRDYNPPSVRSTCYGLRPAKTLRP